MFCVFCPIHDWKMALRIAYMFRNRRKLLKYQLGTAADIRGTPVMIGYKKPFSEG